MLPDAFASRSLRKRLRITLCTLRPVSSVYKSGRAQGLQTVPRSWLHEFATWRSHDGTDEDIQSALGANTFSNISDAQYGGLIDAADRMTPMAP